jgi:hypothetical protein
MTKTKPNPPAFNVALLELITEYGDYRALVASVREEPYRVLNALAAQRSFDDIGAALRSGALPSKDLDARLDVAFGSLLAATEPARPTLAAPLADYGFNPTQPPAEPCLTAVGPGPECKACGGPTSGVHSNHTLTEDAAYREANDGCVPELRGKFWAIGAEGCLVRRSTGHLLAGFAVSEHDSRLARLRADEDEDAADLPPYVTVEVIEQGRDWTRLSVPSVDIGLTATCYVDNGSPAWLAEVPLGKRVVVRLAYEQIGRGPVRAFTDWVEPADDYCSPRLTEGGSWGIGTGDVCPFFYADSPAEAVAAHNAALLRSWPTGTADLGLSLAPAGRHTHVGAGDPCYCSLADPAPTAPVAVSPERLTISDATIAEAERLERLHAHGGRDCYCETPDAVSPERVAEICAALFVVRANRAEAHLAALPEFDRVVESDVDGWPVEVALTGDVRIRRDLDTNAWSAVQP